MGLFIKDLVIDSININMDEIELDELYYVSNSLTELEENVKNEVNIILLKNVDTQKDIPFECVGSSFYKYIYPYKILMTDKQLAEWLSRGYGQCCIFHNIYTYYTYNSLVDKKGDQVSDNIKIRRWGSEDWEFPLYKFYKQDCVFNSKHGRKI